jgi:hypothetical protein
MMCVLIFSKAPSPMLLMPGLMPVLVRAPFSPSLRTVHTERVTHRLAEGDATSRRSRNRRKIARRLGIALDTAGIQGKECLRFLYATLLDEVIQLAA